MRVLVTGGAGYIGSHLVRAYLERGDDVTVVDTLTSGKRQRVPREAAFYMMDIRSPEFAQLLHTNRIELINHQAACVDVANSTIHPSQDAETNIVGSLCVLESAARIGVPIVVVASSAAVYGAPEEIPVPESAPRCPRSPYGVAKLAVELYSKVLSQLYDLNVICLRYANVYGSVYAGHGEGGVLAVFSEMLHGGKSPPVYGDGNATRDFIYISDIVRGNLAAERLLGFHVINLGTSVETSVNNLLAMLHEKIGGPSAEYLAARPGEIRRSALDISLARTTLGWEPEITLSQGLNAVLAQ